MTVRDELQKLYDREGELTPELVLQEAGRPESPLREHFTWDDTEAAARWRLHQAHQLIQKVKIRVRTSPDQTVRVRAFVHAPDRDSYVPTDEALSDDGIRDLVMDQVKRDIEALRNKYKALIDFDSALKAVVEDRAA